MLELAHVALLDRPVHILAVVLEDHRKVFFDADGLFKGWGWLRCHGDSILPIVRNR